LVLDFFPVIYDVEVCFVFRQVARGGGSGGVEYPERAGQPACKVLLCIGACSVSIWSLKDQR